MKIILVVCLLVGLYLLGPTPSHPTWNDSMPPQVRIKGNNIETLIYENEQKHVLKPNNEARIVWFGKHQQKTEYSVVYLHGFSASHEEGNPTHYAFAKKFGCNLYLSRLSDHGIDTTDHLLYFTVDRLWDSAKKALSIGLSIGEKVILMSTSTGGSMALVLAATFPGKVHALINMSPNIEINDSFAFLLNNPWGLYIARLVIGSKSLEATTNLEQKKYWYGTYRLEATVQLQELIEDKMTKETFEHVRQPSLTLYYYKNEQNKDSVVKVDAILKMHRLLGTSNSLKVIIPIPKAGTHVIGSNIKSNDVKTVIQEINKFALEKLHMTFPLQH